MDKSGYTKSMALYDVGTKIDLSNLNDSPVRSRPASTHYDQYFSGTKISFLKMACGMVVMNITEPAIALHVIMRA